MSRDVEQKVRVRHLQQEDLGEADRILRSAFGTFLGLSRPTDYFVDRDYVRTRYQADPRMAWAAEVDGRLAGTSFATRWGSLGFFGPLTVDPDLWDRGVGRALLGPTLEALKAPGVTHRGLFTYAHSPKHLALYQSVGFWPRFLTVIVEKSVTESSGGSFTALSSVADAADALDAARDLTGAVYRGLDLGHEIEAVRRLGLGETLLVYDGDRLAALAVCHVGPGTEAGGGRLYIKFGAARPGTAAPQRFARLLAACESHALASGCPTVVAGVSTGRRGAYRQLLERGYQTQSVGVTLHAPDLDPYHHPDAYVMDDWR